MGLEWPWQVSGTVCVVPDVMTLLSSWRLKAKSAIVLGSCRGRLLVRVFVWSARCKGLILRDFVRRYVVFVSRERVLCAAVSWCVCVCVCV